MKYLIITILAAVSGLLLSCSESKNEKSSYEKRWEKEKEMDVLNLIEAVKLGTKYNAISGWDTISQFTYYLQELFEYGNRSISIIGVLKDIVIIDSSYVLKLVSSDNYYTNSIADVSLSLAEFQKLKKKLEINNSDEGCFVIDVKRITSNYPKLVSEIEYGGTEDARSYLNYDFDEKLIKFEGELIDYFIYKKPDE